VIRLPPAYWPEWAVAALLSSTGLCVWLVRRIDRDLARRAVPEHLREQAW